MRPVCNRRATRLTEAQMGRQRWHISAAASMSTGRMSASRGSCSCGFALDLELHLRANPGYSLTRRGRTSYSLLNIYDSPTGPKLSRKSGARYWPSCSIHKAQKHKKDIRKHAKRQYILHPARGYPLEASAESIVEQYEFTEWHADKANDRSRDGARCYAPCSGLAGNKEDSGEHNLADQLRCRPSGWIERWV